MKVAAGALGAGQPESRWGEHSDTSVGSGLPPTAAWGEGVLMVRSGEGLPVEMRAEVTIECGSLATGGAG